jgi:hypothetical protein
MRPHTPVLAALLLLTVAGCGVHRSAAPAPEPTTTTPTTTTTTPTTTTAVTTTTTVPPATAADGRNLQACQDLTCEVLIRTGDGIPFGPLGTLTVVSIGGDGITTVLPSGTVLTFGGGELTLNDTIVVTTLRMDADAAIIRVVPV